MSSRNRNFFSCIARLYLQLSLGS